MIDKIINEAKNNPHHSTPKQLKRKLSLDVSKRTIRRRLNDNNLHGRIESKEPPFTEKHLKQRIAYADGYKCKQ